MQERTRWLVLAGILLLAGVVVWRLGTGSYRSDIRKVCDAEKASGAENRDVRKAEAWAKDHMETPEASAWLAETVKKGVGERAKALRAQAEKVGISECPLAKTYDALEDDGEYRTDILGMCTTIDLGAIETADDDERLRKIVDWIGQKAKSTRTKALAEALGKTDAKGRADALREAAASVGVYQCELVGVLLKPQSKPKKEDPAIEIGTPQVNGDMSVANIVGTFLAKEPEMRACYETGLAKTPTLGGRLMLKLAIAPKGKTIKATVEKGTTVSDRGVVDCIVKTAADLMFPTTGSPLVTILLPLDFIPKPSMRPVPMIPH
jgi:hypothetical protein